MRFDRFLIKLFKPFMCFPAFVFLLVLFLFFLGIFLGSLVKEKVKDRVSAAKISVFLI